MKPCPRRVWPSHHDATKRDEFTTNNPSRRTSLGQIDGCFFTDTRIGPSDQHSFAIESLSRRPGFAEDISEILRNLCQATQGRSKKKKKFKVNFVTLNVPYIQTH